QHNVYLLPRQLYIISQEHLKRKKGLPQMVTVLYMVNPSSNPRFVYLTWSTEATQGLLELEMPQRIGLASH
ncbi:hypothetical protein STEG23_033904, partial [Scotinomys teguina]